MSDAWRIEFRFRRLDPVQEVVFWALGYGYRSPEALRDLLHVFKLRVVSGAVYELARLGLVVVSDARQEISYSAAAVRLLELARGRVVLTAQLPDGAPQPAIEPLPVTDVKVARDMLRALDLGALTDAAAKLELRILSP